jgi:hypothetical protein
MWTLERADGIMILKRILRYKTTPHCRNTPSTTNLEQEEIVDDPGNDGR